jgi:hypothetical protein
MPRLTVRAHILRDRWFTNWDSEVAGRWSFEDLRSDPGYRQDWISFTSLAWDAERGRLYCGLMALDNDLLHVFDPETGRFASLGFARIGDKFDVKLHRSLELEADGCVLGATALLHNVDQQHEAQGGKLFRYNPHRNEYALLAVPVPSHYIQSIVLDRARRIVYGFTYPGEMLFRYDLDIGACRTLAFVGNGVMVCQPHCAVIDHRGRLWGTWGESRAYEYTVGSVPIRLFSYDPDQDAFAWFQYGLPKLEARDPARVDHMLAADDGYIYVGTTYGALARLDPATGDVTLLGKPCPARRLAGLTIGWDGRLYGTGGDQGEVRLFAYDRESGQFTDLGRLYDEKREVGAIRTHILVAATPGVFFAGENDNPYRSSYLWECHVSY